MEDRPTPRRGNVQRAEWRCKCRQILADHLRAKLGVIIEPNQVRLVPDLYDGYMWVRQPEREHLFTKQLSKHSVGAYMELCREINVSFEAVARVEPTPEESKLSTSGVGYISQLDHLQSENARLTDALSLSEDRILAEIEARQQAEEKFKQREEDLAAAQIQGDMLKRENVHLSSKLRRLTHRLGRSDKEVKKALTVLHRLGPQSHGGVRE
ncbi:hypothetical protein RBB50_012852 [Rhinocladiella similis]